MISKMRIGFLAIAVLLMAGQVFAVVQMTESIEVFTEVGVSDLLETNVSSQTFVGSLNYGSSVAMATDGLPGGPWTTVDSFAPSNGAVLTYALDTVTNPLGYDISSIDTYTMYGDAGRTQQIHDVAVSFVGAPSTFISLASISFDVAGDSQYRRVTLTDDAGPLASGVAEIRFTFYYSSGVWNENCYKELDAFGSPVPEPATMMLLGFGALALLRKRKA